MEIEILVKKLPIVNVFNYKNAQQSIQQSIDMHDCVTVLMTHPPSDV